MNKKLSVLTGVGPETGTGAEIARHFSEKCRAISAPVPVSGPTPVKTHSFLFI